MQEAHQIHPQTDLKEKNLIPKGREVVKEEKYCHEAGFTAREIWSCKKPC